MRHVEKERQNEIKTKDFTKEILKILEDRKAEDVVVIDVAGRSSLADVLIIATGTSEPHLKALAGALQKGLKNAGIATPRVSGDSESAWIIVDMFDIMIHLFLPDARIYYNLESLWVEKQEVVEEKLKQAKSDRSAPKAKPKGKASSKAGTAAKPRKTAPKTGAAEKPRKTAPKAGTAAKPRGKTAPKPSIVKTVAEVAGSND